MGNLGQTLGGILPAIGTVFGGPLGGAAGSLVGGLFGGNRPSQGQQQTYNAQSNVMNSQGNLANLLGMQQQNSQIPLQNQLQGLFSGTMNGISPTQINSLLASSTAQNPQVNQLLQTIMGYMQAQPQVLGDQQMQDWINTISNPNVPDFIRNQSQAGLAGQIEQMRKSGLQQLSGTGVPTGEGGTASSFLESLGQQGAQGAMGLQEHLAEYAQQYAQQSAQQGLQAKMQALQNQQGLASGAQGIGMNALNSLLGVNQGAFSQLMQVLNGGMQSSQLGNPGLLANMLSELSGTLGGLNTGQAQSASQNSAGLGNTIGNLLSQLHLGGGGQNQGGGKLIFGPVTNPQIEDTTFITGNPFQARPTGGFDNLFRGYGSAA